MVPKRRRWVEDCKAEGKDVIKAHSSFWAHQLGIKYYNDEWYEAVPEDIEKKTSLKSTRQHGPVDDTVVENNEVTR